MKDRLTCLKDEQKMDLLHHLLRKRIPDLEKEKGTSG
jgi:hypothetical protein